MRRQVGGALYCINIFFFVRSLLRVGFVVIRVTGELGFGQELFILLSRNVMAAGAAAYDGAAAHPANQAVPAKK